MSDYKCIKPFFSAAGRSYNYGNMISSSEYYNLPPSEQKNFLRNYNDEGRSSSGSSYSNSNDSSWLSSSSTPDYGPDYGSGSDSSSSSDSSSFDFGGGDTGGGGASGDW